MRERTRLDSAIATIKRLRSAIDDNTGLIEMAEAEKDEATIAECEKSLREATAEARKAFEADERVQAIRLFADAGEKDMMRMFAIRIASDPLDAPTVLFALAVIAVVGIGRRTSVRR